MCNNPKKKQPTRDLNKQIFSIPLTSYIYPHTPNSIIKNVYIFEIKIFFLTNNKIETKATSYIAIIIIIIIITFVGII
jgi:hypothetical protein